MPLATGKAKGITPHTVISHLRERERKREREFEQNVLSSC